MENEESQLMDQDSAHEEANWIHGKAEELQREDHEDALHEAHRSGDISDTEAKGLTKHDLGPVTAEHLNRADELRDFHKEMAENPEHHEPGQ